MSWATLSLELTTEIMEYGGVGEFASLSAVCSRDAGSVPVVFERRVHRFIRSFNLPPHRFLPLLGNGLAVASGSFVLALALEPAATFQPGDLDIYVVVEGYRNLVRGLRTMGYRLLDENDSAHDKYADCKNILEKVEVFGMEEGCTYLNIITVAGDDPRAAIFLFHSTVVMNYMDATSITIAYPSLTVRGLALTNEWSTKPSPKRLDCLDKYINRGVTFFSSCRELPPPCHQCGVSAECYRSDRYIDDGRSLRFVFNRKEAGQRMVDSPSLTWHLARPGVMESGYVLASGEVFVLGPTYAELQKKPRKEQVKNALERLKEGREKRRRQELGISESA
ncbi:hypothetical protein BKA70DRAFT_1578506 [Coprinopsis sp. MPI-PUGE-AT-0042]|nr:hypothetical protein BKA70DRAFT_1578506 [Coprinopsis sp. MPI-PUGE-AT-0042]